MTPKPTLWRDMTPEEKGALLLAEHEGKDIELFGHAYPDTWYESDPCFEDDCAYRIKPKREMVEARLCIDAKLAEWQAAQHYTYIGKDGKPVLARDLETRAEEAEARIAHLENHIEGVAKDTHKIMVAYATAHTAALGVAQTLEDAYWSREENK